MTLRLLCAVGPLPRGAVVCCPDALGWELLEANVAVILQSEYDPDGRQSTARRVMVQIPFEVYELQIQMRTEFERNREARTRSLAYAQQRPNFLRWGRRRLVAQAPIRAAASLRGSRSA